MRPRVGRRRGRRTHCGCFGSGLRDRLRAIRRGVSRKNRRTAEKDVRDLGQFVADGLGVLGAPTTDGGGGRPGQSRCCGDPSRRCTVKVVWTQASSKTQARNAPAVDVVLSALKTKIMRRRQEQPLTDLPNEEGDCRPRGEWTQVAVAVHCRGPEWLHSLPSPWFRRPQDRLGLKPPQPQSAPPLNLLFTSAAIHAVLSLGGRPTIPQFSTLAHFHRATCLANHSSSPTQSFSPPSGQLLVTSSPPVPLLAHRHGRCHEGPKFPGTVSIPALVAGQPAITGRVPR